jgi:hypothetical protein
LYVQWLYNNRIFSRQSLEKLKEGFDELQLLIDGFVFGEKVQDSDFKDAVIDALFASVSTLGKDDKYWYPAGKKADLVYKGTPPGSPLRRLLVDMHVHHSRHDWYDETENVDFLADLVRGLLSVRDLSHESDPTRQNISSCVYHHHGDDAQCYSEKALAG